MTTIAIDTCPRCDAVPCEAVFNSVKQVDADVLVEGILSDPYDFELIGIAIDIVTAEVWRHGAIDDPAFRKLWITVRLVLLPQIIAGALGGAQHMLCVLQTMKTFDRTIAAPWEDLPPWPHGELLSPLQEASEETHTLRSGLRRLFTEAVQSACA